MSNADPIFSIVENLAQRIQRSVAVDNANLDYLAHSTHRFGDEDLIRLRSITERHLHSPIRSYVLSMDLDSVRAPLLVRATHEHGFERDRLLVPIRSWHRLVGVLWIIHDEGFSPADEHACLRAAEQLAVRLEASAQDPDEPVFDDHLIGLVSADASLREASARALRELDQFASGFPTLTVAVVRHDRAEMSPETIAALRRAWTRTTAHFGSRPFTMEDETFGFGLVELPWDVDRAEIRTLGESLERQATVQSGARLRWGLGTKRSLEDAHLSHDEAVSAVELGIRLGRTCTLWADHPLEALVETAVHPRIPATRLPPLLGEELDEIAEDVLSTVASYLDHAGSAAQVAEVQHLHRATVYYRIKQFEKSSGLDLGQGRDRLLVHLWFLLRERITAD